MKNVLHLIVGSFRHLMQPFFMRNRMVHIRTRFIAGIFLSMIAGLVSLGQTPTPKPTATPIIDDDVIKINSRLVVVPVSVTDAAGQPVLGLTIKDFKIAEENTPQQIDQVGDAEKVPLEIALLFDVSASTDAMFQFEQETAAKFLQEVMRPEDRATIITVGSAPFLVQARDSAERARVSIRSITATRSSTAFYDSVSYAANYLQKNAPQGTRKVVVVISDGDDTNSEGTRRGFDDVYNYVDKRNEKKANAISKADEIRLMEAKQEELRTKERSKVLKYLQNADTVFYSINPAGNSFQLNKRAILGQGNMQAFADQTGGTAFLPKLLPIDLKDKLQNSANARANQELLTRIFRQLANELRAQYMVQYYAETEYPVGKYVKLAVDVTKPGTLRIRARQGYFSKP